MGAYARKCMSVLCFRLLEKFLLSTMARLKRKPIDSCADYLLDYAPYLRYDTVLADGLAIATGVMEGACRPSRMHP